MPRKCMAGPSTHRDRSEEYLDIFVGGLGASWNMASSHICETRLYLGFNGPYPMSGKMTVRALQSAEVGYLLKNQCFWSKIMFF